ncbi:hypothetical protein K4T07_03775 [Staphylococcus epidermidis]|uniref:hypothetical protein n=1 Tax=Staphylococcus epidermidis TaxID=1282 RepID=UPI00073572F7|nr:hypothetical protein [Staphylococcus epidermidis]MCG1138997.1 hypothetical protein [Staphylococcus epidermidis]MCG1143652.1 hypothetical protein [Staphylococcus epidermidis]MCG1299737.1 hypothetical protein [Staphylococcus epidermidis]MCG1372899.1 hypothetical protein [Staphylococcus epidermidis]MCG1456155.1 hypothetical protein [Staphylococcus epidermidis]
MATGTHYSPKEFAAAYIQTLPHAKDREEFNSNADYWEYLKKRRHFFFNQYIDAIDFADSFGKSSVEIDKE